MKVHQRLGVRLVLTIDTPGSNALDIADRSAPPRSSTLACERLLEGSVLLLVSSDSVGEVH